VVNFTATASGLYVDTGTEIITYTLAGTKVSSFDLPAELVARHGDEISQPVVDPSGNIYLASYYDQVLDKFSPAGQLLWSVDPESGNPTGLFSVGTGTSFELAVSVVQNNASSALVNLSTGAISGSFPLYDDFDYVTQESDGDLLVSGNGHVQTIGTAGQVVDTFGSDNTEGVGVHTGSGTQFYYPAQAAEGSDGTIYTADPLHTIEATSPAGFLEGTTTLGGDLNMGGWNFYLVGSTFFFQGGAPFNTAADNISIVSLSTLQAYLGAPHLPDDSLGWGAGLSTSAAGNYFAPGTTAAVSASFDPWWSSQASHLELSYSVENTASLDAETVPSPTTVPLPTDPSGLSDIPLTIPTLDQQPGPYLVQGSLLDTSTSPPTLVGTTCLPYTVGAQGDSLDLGSLPSGIGPGGPSDPRGVALNAQLGLNGLRGTTIDWSTFLPDCSTSDPTAATCGPVAMTFSYATDDYFKAAYLAAQDNVTYWLLASGGAGGSVPMALVTDGWWEADVAALVRHFATVPAGCASCAPVTKWEAWNEPNNTGWNNGAQYVSQVLQPFDSAVKSVLPGSRSTVIGGSSLEVSIGWWQQLIAAGGLHDLDVASVHPYTGNNDSFEEDGVPAQVEQLESLLGGTPLWFTEAGWWSDGDYDYLDQADTVARAMLWQKVLDIPVWSYFYDEGNWGNDGVSFSLVQASNTDDFVKPAGLATMTTSSEIARRSYLSMPSTGIPQTYEAAFGPTPGGDNDLAAVWSDGLDTTGSIVVTAPGGGSVPLTVTSEYGQSTSVTAASGSPYGLPISGQVTYLSYPVGDTLSVGPTERYGPNLALASGGATASATSGDASAVIDGLQVGDDQGWSSSAGDTAPSLTVDLAGKATIDRIIVDTQSVGSTAPGLRDYSLSVEGPSGAWSPVADVVGQFRTHQLLLAFGPVAASAVRITVTEVDFGGYFGGGVPPWWSPSMPGVAFLHALQVFAGSEATSQVDGSDLTPLLTDDSTPPPAAISISTHPPAIITAIPARHRPVKPKKPVVRHPRRPVHDKRHSPAKKHTRRSALRKTRRRN
jgi:F5/8 type C domain